MNRSCSLRPAGVSFAPLWALGTGKTSRFWRRLSCIFCSSRSSDRTLYQLPPSVKLLYAWACTKDPRLDCESPQWSIHYIHRSDNHDPQSQSFFDSKAQHKHMIFFHLRCAYTSYSSTQNAFFGFQGSHDRCGNGNGHTMISHYSFYVAIIISSMNNIRFTYEEKNQYFGDKPVLATQKEGVGMLLSKYERNRVVDEEQDALIEKKRLVYPGNSLNYSQIYSDLRIDRKEKVYPEGVNNISMNDSKSMTKKDELQYQSTQNYFPKSLPKIRRNSKLSHNRQPSKYVVNSNFEENSSSNKESEAFVRSKAFSISHYDIYKNEAKKMERASVTAKHQRERVEVHFGKDSSVLSSSASKEIDSLIKVDFQNAGEKNLPESIDPMDPSESSNSITKMPRQIQPEQRLQQLNKEEIRIQKNHADGKKKEVSSKEKKETIKQEQRDAQREKDEVLFRRDSRLSRNASVRSKHKDIVIEDVKQEYNMRLKQEDISIANRSQQKQNASFKQKTNRQQNQPAEIKLFQKRQQPITEQNLPEIKHSLSSMQASSPHKDAILQFKEEIKKVQREIHGVREEMHDVKEEMEGVKEKIGRQRVIESFELKRSKGKEVSQSPKVQKQREASAKKEKQASPKVEHLQIQSKEITVPLNGIKAQKPDFPQKDAIVLGDDTNRKYQLHKFNTKEYLQIYQILKKLQKALKVPQIDLHSLIKQVKQYLQVVAMGGLDHLQGYEMPLHRLKIIKNALLYQRISIVIIAFAYAVGKVKDCLKYLINLVGYATNNTLLILKILQESDITAQSKNPILAKSDRLVLKRNYDTIRNNSDIILDSIFKISKYEQAFYEPFKEILKSIGKNSIEQTFYNVLEYFSFFLCVSDLHKGLPFLAVAPNPYLRESIDKRPTLVIDIIQVFCHGTKKSKIHVFRPHTEHFLNQMSQYYEIISFTCAYPNQIDKVIDILDQKHHIKHRLYRHHALMRNNMLYKDPQRIGRDLSRLVMLDSDAHLMAQESVNTIMVPSWKGNKSDTTLAQLCPILAAIALKNLDCREATKRIHDQQLKNETLGIKYLNFGIHLQ